MTAPFLRRPSNEAGGISCGGGDTGFDVQPQPHIFSVSLHSAALVKEVVLPKGTILCGTGFLAPHEDAPTVAGTGKIETISGGEGGSVASTKLSATSVTAYSEPALTGGATILAADTRFRFTAASLTSGKACRVGMKIILPRLRP
jgi:hypothetical protein